MPRMHWSARTSARGRRKLQSFPFAALCLCGLFAALYTASYLQSSDQPWIGRHLLSAGGCSSAKKDWETKGGVLVYFVGVLYLFLGIAIVCDDFFVASLESISEALSLSEDVAGATFMAAGSSAPELFSSLVSLSNPNTSNELGIGTIVGSAVFNILVIIALTAIFAGKVLDLDWKPLTRDAVFYTAAVASIIGVFYDGKIHWWEGMICVFCYAFYILTMSYNASLMSWMDSLTRKPGPAAVAPDPEDAGNGEHPKGRMAVVKEAQENDAGGAGADAGDKALAESEAEEEESEPWWTPPKKALQYPMWVMSLPWYAAMYVTIPNCKAERWKKWYLVSFTSSILWIGLISWYMVEWAARIGCILNIPDTIMGVTVLAAGTSIPDALSSIAVAREGMGDMAVANAVGSNVFDVWLGLGIPWWFVLLIKQEVNEVETDQLLINVIILMAILFVYIGTVIFSGWRMGKKAGYGFLALYLCYALYSIIFVWLLDVFHLDDD